MDTLLAKNVSFAGKYNNYYLGGNICNAFAIGELGSETDFFLLGAEPEDESNYPCLTGNILDSEGNVLFRLVRNMLVINPGNCSKIVSDRVGYEIHDGNDKLIFKVSTVFEKLPGLEEESFVTTMSANFYNKKGELVFVAASGVDERIESSVKGVYGFTGSFGIVVGLSGDELAAARLMLQSHGKIHRVVTGDRNGEEISLDGTALIKANLTGCKLLVNTGEFIFDGSIFDSCMFNFGGPAEAVRQLLLMLQASEPKP